MNWSAVRTIFRKEMLDTFRDKRTLIAMVGVPIVLYPAVIILAGQVMMVQQTKLAEQSSRVAVEGPGSGVVLEWLGEAPKLELVESADPQGELASGALDVVVRTREDVGERLAEGGTAGLDVLYDGTESRSREAVGRIEDLLSDAREEVLKERLAAQGLAESFARPLLVEIENVAPPEKSTGSLLGSVLPLVMVLMLGIGAFYPAVDLTAGEKERGTFETLLSTPTSKTEIIFGKFFAVFVLSILTGLLNLASMVATLMFQLSQIFSGLEGDAAQAVVIDIPPQTAFAILLVLIPLAFFISAVMMTVALMARSFKEAQNYVSPFFLAIVMPAAAVAIPGIELTEATQFIPVANVALLFRDLMVGQAPLDMVFVVFLCTTVYALMALVVATWMFQREDVILSEEGRIPLTFDRGALSPTRYPTLGISLGVFAVVMLLIFYIGTYVQGKDLHTGLIVTQYGLILAPLLAVLWYFRVDLRSTLNLRLPSAGVAVGTLLAAPAWMAISIQISVYQNRVLPAPEALTELGERLFAVGDSGWGVVWLVAVIAVSPAICEEALFRGVLVSGFRQRLPQAWTIVVVGVLFGLFHLSIYRVLPTGLTGIFFTYLAVRSGSILPAVFAHFTLNGLSVLIETESLPASAIDWIVESGIDESGLPFGALAVAAGLFIVGVAVLEISVRRATEDTSTL